MQILRRTSRGTAAAAAGAGGFGRCGLVSGLCCGFCSLRSEGGASVRPGGTPGGPLHVSRGDRCAQGGPLHVSRGDRSASRGRERPGRGRAWDGCADKASCFSAQLIEYQTELEPDIIPCKTNASRMARNNPCACDRMASPLQLHSMFDKLGILYCGGMLLSARP